MTSQAFPSNDIRKRASHGPVTKRSSQVGCHVWSLVNCYTVLLLFFCLMWTTHCRSRHNSSSLLTNTMTTGPCPSSTKYDNSIGLIKRSLDQTLPNTAKFRIVPDLTSVVDKLSASTISSGTPPSLLNPHTVNQNYFRATRSAVIDSTVPSQTNSPMVIEEDANFELSSNSTLPPPTKLVTSIPKLGFGDFHFASGHIDDEDYVVEGTPSSVDEQHDIRVAFGDKHQEEVKHQQNSGQPSEHNDYFGGGGFDFLDYENKIDRTLIIGDSEKMPSPSFGNVYSIQQAIPANFQGCYCDRHYRVVTRPVDGFFYGFDMNIQNGANSVNEQPSQPSTESSAPPVVREKGIFCYCFGESVTEMPKNFSENVRKIVLKRVGLEVLQAGALQIYPNLSEIYMHVMPKLHLIEAGAFSHLPRLITVYIKMAPELRHIPEGVFIGSIQKLTHLKITHSGLEQLPVVYQDKTDQILSMIDFDNSRIRNITARSINVNAESLNIEYNQIEFVANHAFYGSKIAKLSLKGNKKLVYLEELAFSGLNYLRELDLSQTSITKLPTIGLSDSLEVLRISDTFSLKEIPFIYHFKHMKEAHLTYPYHCCAFQFPANHDPVEYARIKKLFNTDKYCIGRKVSPQKALPLKLRFKRNTDSEPLTSNLIFRYIANWLAYLNLIYIGQSNHRVKRELEGSLVRANGTSGLNESNVYGVLVYEQTNSTRNSNPINVYDEFESRINSNKDVVENFGTDNADKIYFPEDFYDFSKKSYKESYAEPPGTFGTPHTSITPKQEFCGDIASKLPVVRCYPTPDAFNPCEDVMGKNYLRIVVWLVASAAVFGNVAVIVVLVSSRFTFNVSKFLMINLSIADLMMGVYLFIIAIVDLRTQGVYFNFAIDWQHGIGCKVAGFITVFAQLLSIFTLTVITLERLFAITFAIQLNRRLKLSLAVKVMIGGWIFVIFMASLPLFGISSYSKTSICLPMEHRNIGDNIYLVLLLFINQLAFILITACYAKMYVSIISQKTRATINDMTIAKRMALLVFTDFACWAPIAFFGLTALAGYPLINVTNSKILLVTIYPLNSCANPFLYVIFTKQYRRDFFILASRYGLCKKKAMRYKNARHHVNYYLNHHHHQHHHVRPNSAPNSNELVPKPNKCAKSNPVSGSVFSQVSCDGQNVHLYKYICKGHHHHHFCAAYSHHSQQSSPNVKNQAAGNNHHQHLHHSCSDVEQTSEQDNQGENTVCSKCASQECVDSQSGSVSSINTDKCNKHRKHKRCHNAHHQHYPRCHCHHHHHHSHHSRCHRKISSANVCKNEYSASCCRSAVFSTIDIYPELSNSHHSNDGDNSRRINVDPCDPCSCGTDNSIKDLECNRRNGEHSQEINSSNSCERVHIMRDACKKNVKCDTGGGINGRVMYTRNKNASEVCQASSKHKKRKPSNPLISLMEKMSLTKISVLRPKAKNGSRCSSPDKESSECSSPYSSSNSSSHRNNHHHHHHHHYRCYGCHHSRQHQQHRHHEPVNERESSLSNQLPMEEQREILRQALQETTTVQEAVAVVEELSSGTRVSMGSSSSSKKTAKPSLELPTKSNE